jgi:small ligand-binding sensory domain FIST
MEQSQVIFMDQIPPEIIINIMEWLNWRELGIISTVNRRWSFIVKRLLERSAWVSTLSQNADLATAVKECFDNLDKRLYSRPNVGFLFVSSFYEEEFDSLKALISARVPGSGFQLIGCSAVGVIGTHHETQVPNEIEDGQPAISITLAKLPDVEIEAYSVSEKLISKASYNNEIKIYPPAKGSDIEDLEVNDKEFKLNSSSDRTARRNSKQRAMIHSMKVSMEVDNDNEVDWNSFVVLAVPSRGAHTYVAKLQEARQRSVIVGGFASGYGSDDIALFLLNDNRDLKFVRRSGIVGLSIGGAIDLNGMSARGCKSLTPVYKVTQGSKSTITELEKYDPENPTKLVPANLLLDVYDQDESMQNRQIFIGISPRPPSKIDPFNPEEQPVDEFTLHAILKITVDQHMVVSYPKIENHYVQLFVLDPQASEHDVSHGLQAFARNQMKNSASDAILGGLLFQCTARGKDFYNKPNVDSTLFKRTFPHISIAGFFAAGEIGPVAIGGGIINRSSKSLKQNTQTVQATVQGFTSVFGVFSAKPWNRTQIV